MANQVFFISTGVPVVVPQTGTTQALNSTVTTPVVVQTDNSNDTNNQADIINPPVNDVPAETILNDTLVND